MSFQQRQKKCIDDIFNDSIKRFFEFAESKLDARSAEINGMFIEDFQEAALRLFEVLKTRCKIEDIGHTISIGTTSRYESVEYMSLSFYGENRTELFCIENDTTTNFDLTDYIRNEKIKGTIEDIIQYVNEAR